MSRQTGIFPRSNSRSPGSSVLLPGVETKAALVRLGQNYNLYLEVLHAFVERHRKTPAIIRQLYNKKELLHLRMLAHTLKGEAANLGITAIREAASRLESEISNLGEEAIGRLTNDLAIAVSGSIKDLARHLPARELSPPELTDPRPQNLAVVLDKLENQLTNRNLGASETLLRLKALLPTDPELENLFAELHRMTEQLQYDRVLHILRREIALRNWANESPA